jgi:autotransporter-associated beta strand protein
MKKNTTLQSLTLCALLGAAPSGAAAATVAWTGLSTVTNLWSDTNNWLPTQLPTANDVAVFGNAGATNVIGAVNSVADINITLTNLTCSTLLSNAVSALNSHTIQINPGVTVTVNSPSNNVFYVGTGADNGGIASNYTSIVGHGTLVVGNPAAPSTNINSSLEVKQGTTVANNNHRATLNLSGLDTFIFAAGKFAVGGDGSSAVANDRIGGTVILAKTNVITCAAPRYTDPSLIVSQPFTIGSSPNNYAGLANLVQLGQQNTINADYFKIGGLKQNVGGTLSFQPGLVNPTVKLRAADGVSRVPMFVVSDLGEARAVSVANIGTLDLRGGIVDARVDQMWVALNGWRGPTSGGVNDTGSGTGTVWLDGGIFDVTTLNIGCQNGDNKGNTTGTVYVRTNATLRVGTLYIGRDAGTQGTATGKGALIILGGQVSVANNMTENDGPGANGTSTLVIDNGGTLDMMPAGASVPGNITVDVLNWGVGTLTNYGTLGLTTFNFTNDALSTTFTVYPGQTLTPVDVGRAGTLTMGYGNLDMEGGTLHFDLDDPLGASDQINVLGTVTLNGMNNVDISGAGGPIAPGTYTLMTSFGMVGDTNNLQISGPLATSRYTLVLDTQTVPSWLQLIISGSSSNLTWSGNSLTNVWDLKTTANWNDGSERFYGADTVTFDDSGSASPPLTLKGQLQPAGVTVNGTKNYTFNGTGYLSGDYGLTNNGTGTLTLNTANSFVGPVDVNAGTLLVNGALGNAVVTVNSSATFGGGGTVLGAVTVQSGATFAPGSASSIGTLAISNSLFLITNSTSFFRANLDTLTCDKVVGLFSVAYGGTLNMVLSGRPVTASDTFKLFTTTTLATAVSTPYQGTFSSIVPAAPGPNLAWNTLTLATDGTLRVVSTTPANLAARMAGNQITFSWPSDNIGWRLQQQVNPVNVGLGTNWTVVTGSTSTNYINVTLNPANGSVFYRLIYP